MYEEIIAQLDSMGLSYTENEDGTITVDITPLDKTGVVETIAALNDAGISYTIGGDTITINAGEPVDNEEAEAEMNSEDVTDAALADLGF